MLLLPIIFFLMILITSMVFTVRQQTAVVIELFGKFYAVKFAGMRLKPPFPLATIVGKVNLRLTQLTSCVEVKTLDNVFVKIPVSVQFRVLPDRVKDAFYVLDDPSHQIESFVLNVIRTSASSMTLEHLYTEKSRIAEEVSHELKERLADFGYAVENILIDQPSPPQLVQDAFNHVIAAQREKEAAQLEGDAKRIRMIAEAEAEKQSKKLQGEGIAAQREAIAKGFRSALETIQETQPGLDESAIIAVLLATNQFDTIRDASQKPGNLILMPYTAEESLRSIANTAAAIRSFNLSKTTS